MALANKKLLDLVNIDDLTGLYNMRSLYKMLDSELDRAARYGRSVCVIMLDMDHFKKVNDNHDHLFGSFVLSEMGRIITENIRTVDFAARYGGDEFLICLTEVDLDGANSFAERLRLRVEQENFNNDHFQIRLTSSIGFAITEPGDLVDGKTLVRHADRALYEAKENGRNQVKFRVIPATSDNALRKNNRELLRKS